MAALNLLVEQVLPANISLILLIGISIYACSVFTIRLYFHPLSKFPGPRIAAATSWYEFYKDVILSGQYSKSFPSLHAKYGSVVRIHPNELHINNRDFFNRVFKNGTDFYKDPAFFGSIAFNDSIAFLTDPHEYKLRYDIVKTSFAKGHVDLLAPELEMIVTKAINQAKIAAETQCPLNIQQLYHCVTADAIMVLLYGRSLDLVMSGTAYPPLLSSLAMFGDRFHLFRSFPILARIALKLPPRLTDMIAPGYMDFRQRCLEWMRDISGNLAPSDQKEGNARMTVFSSLLQAEKDSPSRSMDGLVNEAYFFCFAGTESTSYALSCATYYLLTHPNSAKKLREELECQPVNADGIIEYQYLRNLPYLTAVIKESLRLSSPAPTRLPRIVPKGGIEVDDQLIPPGTAVSMSARMIHFDPDIFPKPDEFNPERWIGESGKTLDKWNVTFSKGTRSCIGINLAYLELYICLANIFNKTQIELYQTDEKAMEWSDHGAARTAKDVHVLVKGVKD
ncbi:cytochrome P450 [Aspergillus costaricaensis CBS 115574]|uniref:Cytochrome P450 n=1 Tax=Aspergillus costaricaensis CBS 115574 TaxID=1448317 RepID=A0ACD1IUG3_9EURO|nr:cytochrome P450 [Aspergillus costaricaensis CBS 115574]RAK94263.1 cytochrome P450 [Aspergillus costaricaensis CBS 115574]